MFKDCGLSELLSYSVAKSYLQFDVTDFFLHLPPSTLMSMAVNVTHLHGLCLVTAGESAGSQFHHLKTTTSQAHMHSYDHLRVAF